MPPPLPRGAAIFVRAFRHAATGRLVVAAPGRWIRIGPHDRRTLPGEGQERLALGGPEAIDAPWADGGAPRTQLRWRW